MTNLVALLDELLATWGARRTSEVAAAIEALSEMFAPVLPRIEGTTRAARHLDWLAHNRQREAIDLPVLLDEVGQGTSTETTNQLEELAKWPADPRTTALAVRLLSKPPFATSSGTQKVWRRLFNLVEEHGDPRAAAALRALPISRIFTGTDRGVAMRERAASVIAMLEADFPIATPTSEDTALAARVAAEIASGIAVRDEARGRAEARLVYLDWLMERGYSP